MSNNSINNIKINLRTDTLQNWTQANPVLNDGEIAIVKFDNNHSRIKIGNGVSAFQQLGYLHEKEFQTNKFQAGFTNKTVGDYSIAAGIYAETSANASFVQGIEVAALSGHDYSFVFNGTNLPGLNDRYTSHGEGTFNINPKEGLSGFYIGENNLCSILKNNTSTIHISDANGNMIQSNLSVIKLSSSQYYELVKSEEGILSNAIYIVESDDNTLNAYGQRVANVAEPVDDSDAINLSYLSAKLEDYVLSSELSLGFDNTDNSIKLKYKDNVLDSVDCTQFLKDDLLSTVNLIDNKLVFKFTNSDISPISVDLSSFIDNYDNDLTALSAAVDNKVRIRIWE